MFKKITLLNGLLLFFCFCHSQDLSPVIIASAGDRSFSKSYTLDWTLGETAIETSISPDGLFTQGFHQPLLLYKAEAILFNDLVKGITAKVFPNPVYSTCFIDLNTLNKEKLYLTISDLKGNAVFKSSVTNKISRFQVNMQHLASGPYILSITNALGTLITSIKVIKAS